jgi:hypothetical protein
MKRRIALILPAALLALAFASAPAGAEFTHATLLSGTSKPQFEEPMQFEEANEPAVSGNGQYVAFQGVLDSRSGVYRRNLETGEVQFVAGNAAAPSISKEGRYVAFTSACDVYRRDMDLAEGEPGSLVVVSALNGSDEVTSGCSQAAPAVAMSADGEKVVFTVDSESNLAGPGTPPSQVAVREIGTKTTTLVSVTPEGKPTPEGGAYPSRYSLAVLKEPLVGGQTDQPPYGDQPTASTAAISADGSTVAWLGTNVPAQVPSSAAEIERGVRSKSTGGLPDPVGSEAEPLWRRIGDGEAAVTRRLLAGSGLDFFYGRGQTAGPSVLSGSLIEEQRPDFLAPVLSENGETVALLANAPSPALETGLHEIQGLQLSELFTDAYAVRVDDNPAVAPEVIPLTGFASYDAPEIATEDVKDVAISPDGTRVAFDTSRTPLESPSLNLISPSAIFTGDPGIYEANLALGTLQRVSAAYDGSEPNGGAGLLSFSGQGTTLAFASRATNLFFGDAVPAWEVYSAEELPSSGQPAPTQIGPAPPPLPVPSEWVLSATATAQPDGSVLLDAQVPGAGRLGVQALAQLPAPVARGAHVKTKARVRVKRAKAGKSKTGKSRGPARASLLTRSVAAAGMAAGGASEIVLHLQVDAAYRSLLSSRDGLYVVLRVTFAVPGHATLVREIPVTLRRVASVASSSPRAVHRKAASPAPRHGMPGAGG